MQGRILIYGVPGAGKTHFSQLVSQHTGSPLLEADTLRAQLQVGTTPERDPDLFVGTCQAYRRFGTLTPENCVRGLMQVRTTFATAIAAVLDGRDEFVVEGAFLDPNILHAQGRMLLVVTSDERRHRENFLRHRVESADVSDEFAAARIIQDFLIREAAGLGIDVVENADRLESNLDTLVAA